MDLLPRLTADDLRDIGVSAVGDRRRLLDAIAALAGALPGGGAVDRPPEHGRPSAPAADRAHGARLEAERRPITVMFCDLVGSTSLAARLDAEDWRNLVSAYLDAASAAVTEFGGHVLKKLGDGLMALFGYPQAQENDAERAVRAALAIQRALTELNARNAAKGAPQLSARIGLESGPVVVDATGEVFGDAPNIAARVQAARRAGDGAHHGSCAAPGRGPVRRRGSRRACAERRAGCDGALSDCARERRPALRLSAAHAAGRARGGAEPPASALGEDGERRGTVCPDRRRTRDRQIAARRGVSPEARRDSAHLGGILVLATLAEYAAAPDRRMGPPALRRRRHSRWPAPRRPREHVAADRSRSRRACAAALRPSSTSPCRRAAPPTCRPRNSGEDSSRR